MILEEDQRIEMRLMMLMIPYYCNLPFVLGARKAMVYELRVLVDPDTSLKFLGYLSGKRTTLRKDTSYESYLLCFFKIV